MMKPTRVRPTLNLRRCTAALRAAAAVVVMAAALGASPAAAQSPPPAPGGGSGSTSPTTTLPHGDGGVTTQPPGRPGASPPSTAPAGPPPPDPSPRVHALLAEIDLLNARDAVPQALQGVATARQKAAEVALVVAQARERLAAASEAVRRAEELLAHLAVALYVDPGQSDLEAIFGNDVNVNGKRSVLLSVSIRAQKGVLAEARKARTARTHDLAEALAAQRVADGQVAEAEQHVRDAGSRATDAQQALGQAIAHIHDGNGGTWSLPIMGASAAAPGEMAMWFSSRGVTPRAGVPIEKLTELFVKEGADEGVRGDMAFAQSIVETGSFNNDDTVRLNNYAGIGHCDTCASGFAFATPQDGVRAQIQLLKSYAQKKPDYKHPLVDKRLRGPAGCCQTWRHLTHVWATAPDYGPVILEMYRQLLVFVVQHRGGVVPAGA